MRKILVVSLVLSFVAVGYAEPIRTVLTKENRFPQPNKLEIGMLGRYVEFDNNDEWTTITPYARYGLLKNLAVFGTAPYERFSPSSSGGFMMDFDNGTWRSSSAESGVGDVTVGFELRTYEDLFGYPWIIPHVEVSFDTGSEAKGLGAGEMIYTLGIAVGTTTGRKLHWVADTRYQIREDSDNIPSVAGSIVWDLDDQFSLIAELQLSRDKQWDRHPLVFMAGMYYKATPALHLGLHGGTTKNSDEDVIIQGKVAYSF